MDTKKGLPKIDSEKIREEEKLDGMILLWTLDEPSFAEDVTLGYEQLIEVGEAFRTLEKHARHATGIPLAR